MSDELYEQMSRTADKWFQAAMVAEDKAAAAEDRAFRWQTRFLCVLAVALFGLTYAVLSPMMIHTLAR